MNQKIHTAIDFVKQVFNGKTIYRILFNWKVKKHCSEISGKTLDLAGGRNASYYSYLPKDFEIIKTNYIAGEGIDAVADLDQPLPFGDREFDAAFLFNAIYILKDPLQTLREIQRILKPGGRLFISSPFVANEMPEPHDYCRFTYEGLERLFGGAGFGSIRIERFGERFTSMAYIGHLFFLISPVRLVGYASSLLLDACIPNRLRKRHPFPLGYFCILQKS